jgi:hypothetical protein
LVACQFGLEGSKDDNSCIYAGSINSTSGNGHYHRVNTWSVVCEVKKKGICH